MKKMRTFDIGNRKAKLFELFLKANKYVYVATEFDTFTRFYFEANDIDLMDTTNFCEQYIKKQPERKPEIKPEVHIIVIIM